ncbi:MAG: DinB family protein [Acidimicrobiales bacterium]
MSTEPAPIEPDTKDWTWVLDTPCPDCGFNAAAYDLATTGKRVRAVAARLCDLIDDPLATTRPNPAQWSALEYACHVRDVFRIYETRLRLMLNEDDPLFANWDQDATQVEDDYASQDPAVVADELVAAAEVIAASFESLTPEQQLRQGRRSDGAQFTVESMTRYFLHDPVHHIWDVQQGYGQLG